MKTRISFVVAVVLVAATTIFSSLLHGHLTGRWGDSDTMVEVGARLEQFPHQVGPWRITASEQFSDAVVSTLRCSGHFERSYQNMDTKDVVHVSLAVGVASTMAVHIPEVCMSGNDYTIVRQREPVTVVTPDGTEHTFWRLTFRSNDVRGEYLRIYYAWTEGRQWSAPSDARFAYAMSPWLYKIQLVWPMAPTADLEENTDPCKVMLEAFLPALAPYMIHSKDAFAGRRIHERLNKE